MLVFLLLQLARMLLLVIVVVDYVNFTMILMKSV